MYREITEVIDGVSNKSFKVLFTRLLIRYLTRLLGFNKASIALSWFIFLYKKFSLSQTFNFSLYIIQTNIFRNNCYHLFSNEKVIEHKIEKSNWANFIVQHSKSKAAIDNAIDYLKLIYDYEDYQFQLSSNLSKANSKFYLYGPNSKNLSTHTDCLIVLTKPVTQDISMYKGSILFLNSYYYNEKVLNNYEFQLNLLEKYDEIYVSCMHSALREGFKRINPIVDFNSGYLCGPQAFGIILQTLVMNYTNVSCIIEGFDLYLEKISYNSHYPSGFKLGNGDFNEKMLSWGLIDHDVLYNFLYVKKICESIHLTQSESFQNIINMSGDEYMEKFINVRDFSKI